MPTSITRKPPNQLRRQPPKEDSLRNVQSEIKLVLPDIQPKSLSEIFLRLQNTPDDKTCWSLLRKKIIQIIPNSKSLLFNSAHNIHDKYQIRRNKNKINVFLDLFLERAIKIGNTNLINEVITTINMFSHVTLYGPNLWLKAVNLILDNFGENLEALLLSLIQNIPDGVSRTERFELINRVLLQNPEPSREMIAILLSQKTARNRPMFTLYEHCGDYNNIFHLALDQRKTAICEFIDKQYFNCCRVLSKRETDRFSTITIAAIKRGWLCACYEAIAQNDQDQLLYLHQFLPYNITDRDLAHILNYAISRKKLEIVDFLLSYQSRKPNLTPHRLNKVLYNPNYVDTDGNHALDVALVEENYDLARRLLPKMTRENKQGIPEMRLQLLFSYLSRTNVDFDRIAAEILTDRRILDLGLSDRFFKQYRRYHKFQMVKKGSLLNLSTRFGEHPTPMQAITSVVYCEDKRFGARVMEFMSVNYHQMELQPFFHVIALASIGKHDYCKKLSAKPDKRLKIFLTVDKTLVKLSQAKNMENLNGVYHLKNAVFARKNEMSIVETAGVIFHELIHFAMLEVFNFDANPFSKDDVLNAKEYQKIVVATEWRLRRIIGEDKIAILSGLAAADFPELEYEEVKLIKILYNCFFDHYSESQQSCELVAHLLQSILEIGPDFVMPWLQDNLPELYTFYDSFLLPKINQYLKRMNVDEHFTMPNTGPSATLRYSS